MAIAAVQRLGKGGAAVSSLAIGAGDGWATPTAGNLLVASGNSDATITMTTAGFTAGPSVVDGNGAYAWYKVAAGTESTITITPGSAANTCMTVAEYSGVTASPFDAQNSSTIAGTAGTTTTTASVTTTAAADLVVAFALVHAFATDPATPSWSNSFVNQLSPTSAGAGNRVLTFMGELLPAGAAGSYSSVCTWTNNADDRQHIILAFKVGAGGPAFIAPEPFILGQAINRSNTY